jgi:hypothetical protein
MPMKSFRLESAKPKSASAELYGLGGWLILPFLLLVGGTLSALLGVLGHLSGQLSSFSPALPATGVTAHHSIWLAVYAFQAAMQGVLLVSSTWLLVAFFRKRRTFAKWVQWYLLLSATPTVLFYGCLIALGTEAYPPRTTTSPRNFPQIEIAFVVIEVAVWILYFKYSRRVKNTFVN